MLSGPVLLKAIGERRERKRQRVDGNLSDVSEDHKNTGDGSDDGRTKEMKSPYISPRDTLEEQLRHVQCDIDALNDQKDELERLYSKHLKHLNSARKIWHWIL
eukprot:Gb_19961 [translate_table: standard]